MGIYAETRENLQALVHGIDHMLMGFNVENVKRELWKGYPLETLGGKIVEIPDEADVAFFSGILHADDAQLDFYIYINPNRIMEDKPKFSWEFIPNPRKDVAMDVLTKLDKHIATELIAYGETVDSILMEDEKPSIVKINNKRGISMFIKAILPEKLERYRQLSLRIRELLKKYLSERDRFIKFMLKAEKTNPDLLKVTQGSVIIDAHNEKAWELLEELTENIFLNPLDHLLPEPQTVYEAFDRHLLQES